MRPLLQPVLLGAYRAMRSSGVLSTGWGRSMFETAYAGYKRFLEAGQVDRLRDVVRPGTWVIDVGANVGFFTLRFARWVSAGGKVIAIEPEALNYSRLTRAVSRAGFDRVVEMVPAAAAETAGEVRLEVNPFHPGDHKLGAVGVVTAAVTIDGLLAARGWPEVSLIKIDVQGTEARVLAGADAAVRAFHPALFVEVDDRALKRFDSSAEGMLASLLDRGYTIHRPTRTAVSRAMTLPQALELQESRGYVDLLLLHGGRLARR